MVTIWAHADRCCSHINQQIALKTIKKLNFSVQAVWNGKEAVDYLSQDFSAQHPRPDLILMDVSTCAGAQIKCLY
jgi:CheY-like chemotaxis protein